MTILSQRAIVVLCAATLTGLLGTQLTPQLAAGESCRLGLDGVPDALLAPQELDCMGSAAQAVEQRLRSRLTRCVRSAETICPAAQKRRPAAQRLCSYDGAQIAAPLLAPRAVCIHRRCRSAAARVRARLVSLLETTAACPQATPAPVCKDRCGDGKCDEVVCLAIGCPCAEDAASCPADCSGS